MNLHEIAAELKNLEEELDNAEDQPDQAEFIKAKIGALEMDFDHKAAGLTRWVINLESEAEALAIEIKRLQALKKSKENKIEGLREWLKWNLKSLGMKMFDAGIAKVSLRATAERLDTTEEAEAKCWEWPQEVFEKVCEQTVKIRKSEFKNFPKEQLLALPGVRMIPAGHSLQIR